MLSIATMPSQRFVNGGKRQDLRSRWVRSKNSSRSSVIRKGGKSARRKGPNYIGCGKSITIQYHLERLAQPNELGWPCSELVKHLTCQSSATLVHCRDEGARNLVQGLRLEDRGL